jgi:hypothetical protein
LKEAYMTVNEDETTDTTSGLEDEGLLTRSKEGSKLAAEEGTKSKRAVQEGIKSSDDESEAQEVAAKKAPVVAK